MLQTQGDGPFRLKMIPFSTSAEKEVQKVKRETQWGLPFYFFLNRISY